MKVEDTETAPKWRGGEGVRMTLFSLTEGFLALSWVIAERSRRGRPSSSPLFRHRPCIVEASFSCHVPRRRSRSQEHAGSSSESPCSLVRLRAWVWERVQNMGQRGVFRPFWRPLFGRGLMYHCGISSVPANDAGSIHSVTLVAEGGSCPDKGLPAALGCYFFGSSRNLRPGQFGRLMT